MDRYASRVALDADGRTLTYGELDRSANQLAHHLSARGVRPGSYVGVLLARGIDVHVALLAVLKAGAAYVPLDPECPADRVAQIARTSNMRLLLSHQPLAALAQSAGCEVVLLDAERASIDALSTERLQNGVRRPIDPAYAIFTSGSTGEPKGVSISLCSLAHFVRAEASVFDVRPDDRVYQGFSLAFDA
ncbi:MAG TPA: AMP-binding protein, partial [Polyangiales bacterium]